MPDSEEMGPGARKILPIIYVIDTSGSMMGTRIAAVNQAMRETMEVLKEVSEKNPTAELKIGVLQFASGASWVTSENELTFMEDFFWSDLEAGGLTDLGSALDELYDKLSRSTFLDSKAGYKVPVLIFISDGGPTDNYKAALGKIAATNDWYKAATKIAIAIDDESDTAVLTEITGNSESVIKVTDMETLKKLIKVVSVTASMIGGQSRTGSDISGDVMNTVSEEMKGEDVVIPEPNPTVPTGFPPDDTEPPDWEEMGDWS